MARNYEQFRRYRKTHRKKFCKYQKRYRLAHLKECRAREEKRNTSDEGRFTRLKTWAKRRGIKLLLTFEGYLEIRYSCEGHCFYCAGPLPKYGYGLDRIDNDCKEYSITNSVPCCHRCGNRKSNRSMEWAVIHIIIPAIRERIVQTD